MKQTLKHTLIRTGVYETNSSSCHSISIAKGTEVYDTIVPDSEGKIILTGGEFGGSYSKEHVTDAFTKANYAALLLIYLEKFRNQSYDPKKAEFANMHYVQALYNFHKVIKEHTGAEEIIFDFTMEDYNHHNYSYIDHDSVESKSDFEALTSAENIKEFIFNPKSVLTLQYSG